MADGDANQARSTVPLFPHSAVSETAIRSICYLPHMDIITRSTHVSERFDKVLRRHWK